MAFVILEMLAIAMRTAGKVKKHKICAKVRKIVQNQDALSIFQIYFQFQDLTFSNFEKLQKNIMT